MSARRLLSALLAIGMVTAGCGATPAESPDPQEPATSNDATSTPSSTAGSPTGEFDVIVVPDENGEYPPDLIVTCPSGPSFPISALEVISDIGPDDPDGMLAALDPFLDSEEGAFWPQEGWQLLHESQRGAILVTSFEGSLAYMFLDRDREGWVWGGSSISGDPCELQYALPAGLNTVEWRLDPAAPEPGSDTMELRVLLTERECVSGQEIGDRLVGPQIVLTNTDVRIVFAAEPPPGDAFNCQGNPETPYTVELPEPLGNREIIEAKAIGIRLEDYVR